MAGVSSSRTAVGVMLEDEGVAGTCHIGVGTSITLGGTVKAPCHYDFIMRNPTISVEDRVMMKDGTLLLGS